MRQHREMLNFTILWTFAKWFDLVRLFLVNTYGSWTHYGNGKKVFIGLFCCVYWSLSFGFSFKLSVKNLAMFCWGFPFKLEINENNRCHLGSPCSSVKTLEKWQVSNQEKVNIHSGSTPQKTNHTGRERTFKSYTRFTLTCLIFNLSIICLCSPALMQM